MCGILGSLSKQTKPEVFVNGLDAIAHRGPDGYGIWQSVDGNITLGHRRLSILDLSDQGKQPMHFGKYSITFNGEIYNFVEIKKELEGKGHHFQSESDTEVILVSFQVWGHECLARFNGMWSLAIWDNEKKELFLSRDRFGKKPLFYAFLKDQLVFGSEMKALFPFLPEVKPSSDFEWCKHHLFDYESTDKCLIEGIKRFPKGSYAVVKPGDTVLKPVSFWNTMDHLEEVPENYDDQVARFRELFIDACKIRMRSDVAIGTALSGGLDSSATICTMAEIGRQNPETRVSNDWQHAFVATFPGTFLDETVYAKKVVDHISIDATYLPIDPGKGIDKLFRYQYFFEELYLTSPIPMIDLYKSVKDNGVTVTIDGHGADELFSGYGKDIYKAFLDCGLNMTDIRNILDTYEGLRSIDHVQVNKESNNMGEYFKYMAKSFASKAPVMHRAKKILAMNGAENPQKGQLGFFNSYLYKIFHTTILPTLLRNYDRYAMASGVEIRMPFMDHRLVSFCFSLGWRSKLDRGYTKTIVRDALADLMPKDVVWRKSKIGFNTPIVDWIKHGWKEFLLDEMASADFNNCDLIEKEMARKKVMQVMTDPNASFGDGEQAWAGLMPYFWEKGMIKSIQ